MSQFPGQDQYGSWGGGYNRMPPRMPNMGGKGGQQPQGRGYPGGGYPGGGYPPRMPSPGRKGQNQNIPQPGGYYPQPPSSPTYPGSVYPMPSPGGKGRGGSSFPQPYNQGGYNQGGYNQGSYNQPRTPFDYGRTQDMSYRFGGRGRPSNMYGFNSPHYQAYEGYQPNQPPPDQPPPDQPPPNQPPPNQPPPYNPQPPPYDGGGKGGYGGQLPGYGGGMSQPPIYSPGGGMPGAPRGGGGKGGYGGQLPTHSLPWGGGTDPNFNQTERDPRDWTSGEIVPINGNYGFQGGPPSDFGPGGKWGGGTDPNFNQTGRDPNLGYRSVQPGGREVEPLRGIKSPPSQGNHLYTGDSHSVEPGGRDFGFNDLATTDQGLSQDPNFNDAYNTPLRNAGPDNIGGYTPPPEGMGYRGGSPGSWDMTETELARGERYPVFSDTRHLALQGRGGSPFGSRNMRQAVMRQPYRPQGGIVPMLRQRQGPSRYGRYGPP